VREELADTSIGDLEFFFQIHRLIPVILLTNGATSDGIFSSSARHFAVLNGEVLNGLDASGNDGPWATDGTAAGTHELGITDGYAFTLGLLPNYLTTNHGTYAVASISSR
jgi:hypothetical protein